MTLKKATNIEPAEQHPMGLINANDGAGRKRKKADVMEVIDEVEDNSIPSQHNILQNAPGIQFETNMIDDSTASGAKKKKKKKKKVLRDDDEYGETEYTYA